MEPGTKKQSTGAALVFVLMALIALLALAVVFLSRSGREVPDVDTAVRGDQEAITTATEETGPMMIVNEEQSTATPTAELSEPVQETPPPPPPPVATPDNRNLPPEG